MRDICVIFFLVDLTAELWAWQECTNRPCRRNINLLWPRDL